MSKHNQHGPGISLDVDKPRASGESWWVDAPRAGFTAVGRRKLITQDSRDAKMPGVTVQPWPKQRSAAYGEAEEG